MIVKICGIALITLILTIILNRLGSSIALFLPHICSVFILGSAITALLPIISFIKELAGRSEIKNDAIKTLLSACFIAILARIISDLCKENGKEGLKNSVEFCANAEIILLSLPILKELIASAAGILTL